MNAAEWPVRRPLRAHPAARRLWRRIRSETDSAKPFDLPLSRDGADRAVSSSAVKSSNALPSRSRPALSRKAISWSSGESIIVGQLGQLGWVEVAQTQPLPIELLFHPQRGLPQLGMGLGGAAEDQGLVAAGQTLLVVTVVETKSDQGGAEAARSWAGLLHQDHRAVDLSRVGCRNRWRIERRRVANRLIGRARHAIVLSDSLRPSNSAGRENRTGAADVTGNGLTIRPGIPSRPCGRPGKRP